MTTLLGTQMSKFNTTMETNATRPLNSVIYIKCAVNCGIVLSKSFRGMAMLSAAALLDELMGADRDLAPDQKGKSTHWSDTQVSH